MKRLTSQYFFSRYMLLFVVVFGVAFNSYSQCPTVTNPVQSFCDVDSPVISNLSATNNGNGVRWYATANSTTPLANGLGLINGEDYYADDNSGSCGSRQRVDVVVLGPPTGLSFQGVCVDDPGEATIADLIANGNDLQWYNVPSGGAPLATSSILTDNTIYYVDQSNPGTGCRTSRLSVFVNVGVVPVPIGNAIQEFCADLQPPPTVADLQASGLNNWYQTISSASPLDPSTPLIDGQSYYATTVDPPCESIERLEVLVVLNDPNDSGTNGAIDLCETDLDITINVNLFDALGGTPQTTGTWTGPLSTTNGHIGTLNVTTLEVDGSPYVFTYAVSSDSCETSNSTVSITILPIPDAGTNGALELCATDAPQDLFGSLGGTPESGGTWSPTLASGTGVFDPAVDAPGIYTYTVSGTPPCADGSATVTVSVNPPPIPGTNGTLTLCETDTTPQDLFDSLGGTPDAGGTWSPALASGTGLFDPAVDAPGTYTYTVTGTPPCIDASATVTVVIIPAPIAGTNGTLELCATDAPQDLFGSLGGTPESGGTWSPTLASGTGVFDPVLDAPGIYTYTVTGTPPCADASATVTVTVNPPPIPGTNGTLTLCETDTTPQDLFDSLGGTPDAGGTWSPELASGTGLFDPTIDAPGTYTYTVTGTPPCIDASATVTVIINQIPDAGMDGILNVCSNDAPVNLFDSLGGAPDAGGIWLPPLASGTGVFNPVVDTPGIYTYTLSGSGFCGEDASEVMVTITPEPNVSGLVISFNSICLNDPAEVFISEAAELSDGQYFLTYTLSGANNSQTTIVILIVNGAASFNIPAALLTNPGITTFSLVGLQNEITTCSANVSTIPSAQFNIVQDESPQLITNGNAFCLEDNPTIADLTNNLVSTNPVIWYDALEKGNVYAITTPLIDGTTYYASSIIENGCNNSIRLAVTVSIDSCKELELIIPDGFSPNGDTINDDFLIKNLRELHPDFKLQIYNRYGNILYEGDSNTPNWNGTSNKGRELGDSILPVGVYFFILDLNDTNKQSIQGRVYLSR